MSKKILITAKILNLLNKQKKIKNFLKECEKLEILFKNLTIKDIKRINKEYPNFLNFNQDNAESNNERVIYPFLGLTLLKHDFESKNYDRLKKIKVYIDNVNDTIIRILQN